MKKVVDPDPAGQKSTDPDPHPCVKGSAFKIKSGPDEKISFQYENYKKKYLP